MRGFRFRLEQLLGLRAAAEEETARKLADARRAVDEAQSSVDRIVGSEAELREQVGRAMWAAGTVGAVQNLDVVREQLARQRLAAEAELSRAEGELTEALENHRRAHQEREILDRLRTRRSAEWRVENGRREQAVLDESGRGRGAAAGDWSS
ncbi:MAG: flagellar export protein FliJ [Gemmatimonadetes bacterium]|nr:flagellar export protein FliJ [Gemmatimonadota bacterium]